MTRTDLPSLSTVVPPYLLNAIAENGATKFPKAAVAARSFLAQDQRVRELRAQGLRTSSDGATARTVSADQQAAGRHLIDVHDALRAELDRLRDLSIRSSAGSPAPATCAPTSTG